MNGLDDNTKNVGFQVCVGGTTSTQNLTLSSGHVLLGGVQVPYSALSNASGNIQNNLQLSGGTPQSDPTL